MVSIIDHGSSAEAIAECRQKTLLPNNHLIIFDRAWNSGFQSFGANWTDVNETPLSRRTHSSVFGRFGVERIAAIFPGPPSFAVFSEQESSPTQSTSTTFPRLSSRSA
jgi:hypothetical protein